MDISSTLFEHGLHVRSISVWRCESGVPSKSVDLDEIWITLGRVLDTSSLNAGVAMANKKSGFRVIRAVSPPSSSQIGKKPFLADFRKYYSAAVVAYQKDGENAVVRDELSVGDLLVLQTMEGSAFFVSRQKIFTRKPII
jgi:hypothetical protein